MPAYPSLSGGVSQKAGILFSYVALYSLKLSKKTSNLPKIKQESFMYNQIIITAFAHYIHHSFTPFTNLIRRENRLELSWSLTKVTSAWNSQPRCPFSIIGV